MKDNKNLSKKITIAVDAMGGDFAPQQNVLGAKKAIEKDKNLNVLLVGDPQRIKEHLNSRQERLEVIEAEESIFMTDSPLQAVKKKPNSSLVVAANMVHQHRAKGFISAGNTGAMAAVAFLKLGRIKGINRPGIATLYPTARGRSLIIDAGANVDCRPMNLVQFAQMGSIYMKNLYNIDRPSIGLLNIGEEESKGNKLSIKAYHLLSAHQDLNFVGNIEGHDLPAGTCDVIVCDGFTGNVALKLMEGTAKLVLDELKTVISSNVAGRLLSLSIKANLTKVSRKLNPDSYGGSLLLGVKGLAVVAHGNSSSEAIGNAIIGAAKAARQEVTRKIAEQIGN